MNATDTLINPGGCLRKSADDEPVFVLCARDPQAPGLVRKWAKSYIDSRADQPGYEKALVKYRDACAVADAMERWKRTQPAQAPQPT